MPQARRPREMAFEVNPEAFVPVPMLYAACSVNDVPLKAFVDTGDQMAVMTAKCVQHCKLEQKVDHTSHTIGSHERAG